MKNIIENLLTGKTDEPNRVIMPYRVSIRNISAMTLVEVLVSLTVMSMMMIALLAYVKSASDVWRKTDQIISLTGEASQVFDTLRWYGNRALSVSPSIGNTQSYIKFDIPMASGTWGAANFKTGRMITLFERLPAPDYNVLVATYTAYSTSGPGKITFIGDAAENSPEKVSLLRFIGPVAVHVSEFRATRIATNSLEVFLRLESPIVGEQYEIGGLATPSFEATASFFLPST